MTASITYDHGVMNDCNVVGDWTYGSSANIANPGDHDVDCLLGDIIEIELVADGGAGVDEWVYYEWDCSNISTVIWPLFLGRYKTEGASGGMAKIELEFTAGTQVVLAAANATTWTKFAVAITTSKTLDKIRLYCDNTGAGDGTYHSYYDFVLVCGGSLEFPYVARDGRSGGIKTEIERKTAVIPIPGRDGNIIQDLGVGNPIITLTGDMDTRSVWDTGGTTVGHVLYDIIRSGDPWQWFECDSFKGKFAPKSFLPSMEAGSRKELLYDLMLEHYSLSGGQNATWDGITQWWGIT